MFEPETRPNISAGELFPSSWVIIKTAINMYKSATNINSET